MPLAQSDRRADEAGRHARRNPLRQAVDQDAPIGRERGQRRVVAQEAIDAVLDQHQVELLGHLDEILPPPRREADAQRVVQQRLQIDRRQRAFPVRLLDGVGAQAGLVHGERHQRHAQAPGVGLHHRIGERLDAEPPAHRHHRADRGGDRLPAVAGEEQSLRFRPPSRGGEKLRGDVARRRRAIRSHQPQRAGQCLRARGGGECRRHQLGLHGQDREVELQIDARVGDLGRHRALGRAAQDVRAPADLAGGQAAPDQLAVDAARRRDGDVVAVGEGALRQQPIARLQIARRRCRRQVRPPASRSRCRTLLLRDQCFDCVGTIATIFHLRKTNCTDICSPLAQYTSRKQCHAALPAPHLRRSRRNADALIQARRDAPSGQCHLRKAWSRACSAPTHLPSSSSR